MNGGVPVYCPIRPAGDSSKDMSASEWKIDIKELESKITPRSKIIVLNTPHNPIGKVFSREELEEIGALATKHNLLIISDEVVRTRLYLDCSIGGNYRTPCTDTNIVLFSFVSASTIACTLTL